jgi:type I restriction enzyme S subunit
VKTNDNASARMGWVEAPLQDFCLIIQGQSPPGDTYNADGQGVPFFQGKAEFGELYPTPAKWCSSPTKIAERDDILISIRAPVGPTNLCPTRACIGRGLAAIRPLGGVNHRYVLYNLRHSVQSLLDESTGSTFDAISGKTLREHIVPLAPLRVQHSIVAEIEKQFTRLDATVAALKRVQANLKRYRAAVLKAAFEGRLTTDWRKRPHVGKSDDSLVDKILAERKANWERGRFRQPVSLQKTELVSLPESWTWQPFDAFVTDSFYGPRFGENQYAEQGVPTIRTTDIAFDGNITLKNPPRIDLKKEELQKYGLRDGDLLVTRTGATIGKCALYKENIGPAIPSAYLIRFRLTRMSVPPRYPLLFLMSPRGQELLLRRSTAVAQPNVNATAIAQFAVPLPPQEEIYEIVRRVDALFESAEATEKNVIAAESKVEKLRQSILARAVQGKLIPQDPDDEPANVLLERIRANRNATHKSAPTAPRRRRKKEAAHVS